MCNQLFQTFKVVLNNTFTCRSIKTLLTSCAFFIKLSGSDNTPSFSQTRHKGTILFNGLFSIALLCVRSCNNTENRKIYWGINILFLINQQLIMYMWYAYMWQLYVSSTKNKSQPSMCQVQTYNRYHKLSVTMEHCR